MGLLWDSYGFPMGFPWDSWVSYGILMGLPLPTSIKEDADHDDDDDDEVSLPSLIIILGRWGPWIG